MSGFKQLASERGAVLIQTAIASFVLIGFSTFVVDYGVLWVGRHQAQNAADAGAMAGAIARAYDDFDDPPDPTTSVAAQYALQAAQANLVWGASAPVTASVVSFDGVCPPEVGLGRCVRMDVYRNGEQLSSPLPAWFTPALGLPATQGVRATARARVLIANATNCLRPWAIPDKWTEGSAPADGNFTRYGAGGAPLASPDVYTSPTPGGPGTGYAFATSNVALGDVGASVPLTFYTGPADPIVPGWLVPLDPPGSSYVASRDACNGQPIAIGDQIPVSATLPIPFDFHSFFTNDFAASWDPATRTIHDSCAPGCAPFSPRLIAMAVFDVDLFQYGQATGDWGTCAGPCVTVVNIVGFFVDHPLGANGYLTSYPGLVPTDLPRLTAASSFLKAVTLVR